MQNGWHHYVCLESWKEKRLRIKVWKRWIFMKHTVLLLEDQCGTVQVPLKKGWRQAEEHQLIPLKWWNGWISPTWTQLTLLNHHIPSCHIKTPLFKWYPNMVVPLLMEISRTAVLEPPRWVKVRLPTAYEGGGWFHFSLGGRKFTLTSHTLWVFSNMAAMKLYYWKMLSFAILVYQTVREIFLAGIRKLKKSGFCCASEILSSTKNACFQVVPFTCG